MRDDKGFDETVDEAYNRLLELLGPREHFEEEARRKLLARGYAGEVVEAALTRAREHAYLDEQRAVETWIRQQLRKGGHGSAWLLARLGQKGVDGTLAAETLREAYPREVELEEAMGLARRSGNLDDRRLAGRLARRGFAASVVAEVLRRLDRNDVVGED